MIKVIILFAKGDSINPEEWTFTYKKNKNKPNIKKTTEAKKQNIAVEIRAAAKPNLSVPSPTLVTVIANILENALHGAAASEEKEPRITVSIKHKSGHLVIVCENTCSHSLDFEEMPEYLQGVGIHSVISSAEKHNGSCRFTAADGVFRCVVIMDE